MPAIQLDREIYCRIEQVDRNARHCRITAYRNMLAVFVEDRAPLAGINLGMAG
jgi:hypothetical protein